MIWMALVNKTIVRLTVILGFECDAVVKFLMFFHFLGLK